MVFVSICQTSPRPQAMPIESLPVELIHQVVDFLAPRDIASLTVCSVWLHVRINGRLYQEAAIFRLKNPGSLTEGIINISFWHDSSGNGSILEWAAINGHFRMFNRLLQEPGVDLIQSDSYRVTLLHRLAAQGKSENLLALMEKSIELGLDPFPRDQSSLTPLHFAAGRGMEDSVRVLLALRADPSDVDYHGNTPLHLAACSGSHNVFELLVKAGADVNSRARFGWTAIDQASITRNQEAVERLLALGSEAATCQKKEWALNEFLRLAPCPQEYCFPEIVF